MTGIIASSADEADVELYSQGSCHAFAVALHRKLGMSFLVVTDPDSVYWEDESDADGMAWDVLGARPVNDVCPEILERHPDVGSTDTDEFPMEEGMTTYVDGMGEPIDRPLHELSDSDVEEAWECARRVLAGVPGFPASQPRP